MSHEEKLSPAKSVWKIMVTIALVLLAVLIGVAIGRALFVSAANEVSNFVLNLGEAFGNISVNLAVAQSQVGLFTQRVLVIIIQILVMVLLIMMVVWAFNKIRENMSSDDAHDKTDHHKH